MLPPWNFNALNLGNTAFNPPIDFWMALKFQRVITSDRLSHSYTCLRNFTQALIASSQEILRRFVLTEEKLSVGKHQKHFF